MNICEISKFNILIFEDNPGDSALIERMFSGAGQHPSLSVVKKLSDGIELLESNKYNVILLDLSLPDSSGVDTFDRINQLCPEIPIIILTGQSEEKTWMTALEHGAQDYLVKGEIDSNLLIRTVCYSVERKLILRKLTHSIQEKEALLQEINHRVKNNLQILSSIISIEMYQNVDGSESGTLKDIQHRINTIALIHEKLQLTEDNLNINLKDYLSNLAQDLLGSYRLVKKNIGLKLHLQKIYTNTKKAVELGLIVNEIMTNAIKYAFPGEEGGEITISLHKDDCCALLSIGDNGVGLPEGFDPHKDGSIGLKLVSYLLESGSGTFDVKGEKGVEFSFRLPLPENDT